MRGDKIKGQAPIKLNEWYHKRGNDRNAIPFHNIRFIFGYIVVFWWTTFIIASYLSNIEKASLIINLKCKMWFHTEFLIVTDTGIKVHLSKLGEEIIDSKYKQEKKNSIITFPGDLLVV